MSTLSVRLSEELKKRLDLETQRTGLRRSDVIRLALERCLPRETEPLTGHQRYERVKHFLGSLDSGIPDLGTEHEKHLRRIFDEKRADIMGHGSTRRAR